MAELCREHGMSNASFYNGIRETGDRYPAKLNDENAVIADWLLRLESQARVPHLLRAGTECTDYA